MINFSSKRKECKKQTFGNFSTYDGILCGRVQTFLAVMFNVICVFSRATAELANGTLPTGGLCVKEQRVQNDNLRNICDERNQCKSILTTHHSTHRHDYVLRYL